MKSMAKAANDKSTEIATLKNKLADANKRIDESTKDLEVTKRDGKALGREEDAL